tara:strand:+ start:2089 stop:2499 length:411 start_codon:yes stop_codon:yes gene_type:complete
MMSWMNILKNNSRFIWNTDIFAWSDKHKNWLKDLDWKKIVEYKRSFPIWQIEKHFNTQIADLNEIMQKLWDVGSENLEDKKELQQLSDDLGNQYQIMITTILNNANDAFRQIAGIQYDIETTDMTTGAVKLKWVEE